MQEMSKADFSCSVLSILNISIEITKLKIKRIKQFTFVSTLIFIILIMQLLDFMKKLTLVI